MQPSRGSTGIRANRMAQGGRVRSESRIRKVTQRVGDAGEDAVIQVNPVDFYLGAFYQAGPLGVSTWNITSVLQDSRLDAHYGETLVAIIACRNTRYWANQPAGWRFLGAETTGLLDVVVSTTTYSASTNAVFTGALTPSADFLQQGIQLIRFTTPPDLTVGLAGIQKTTDQTSHPWPGTSGGPTFPVMHAIPTNIGSVSQNIWSDSVPPPPTSGLTRSNTTGWGVITMVLVPFIDPMVIRTGHPRFVTTLTTLIPSHSVTPSLEWT